MSKKKESGVLQCSGNEKRGNSWEKYKGFLKCKIRASQRESGRGAQRYGRGGFDSRQKWGVFFKCFDLVTEDKSWLNESVYEGSEQRRSDYHVRG